MRKFKKASLITFFGTPVLVFVLMLTGGCATTPKTPLGKQVEAFTVWNDLLESYNYQYDQADPETQAIWKEKIDPIIKKANDAMLDWGKALDDGISPEEKAEAFIKLKNQVIELLVKHSISVGR